MNKEPACLRRRQSCRILRNPLNRPYADEPNAASTNIESLCRLNHLKLLQQELETIIKTAKRDLEMLKQKSTLITIAIRKYERNNTRLLRETRLKRILNPSNNTLSRAKPAAFSATTFSPPCAPLYRSLPPCFPVLLSQPRAAIKDISPEDKTHSVQTYRQQYRVLAVRTSDAARRRQKLESKAGQEISTPAVIALPDRVAEEEWELVSK